MKTNLKRDDKKYLMDQPKLDALLKALVQEAADDLAECYEGAEVEPIECISRDGFYAASDNCGGYIYRGFTDVLMIWGSGNYPQSKEARKQIDKQYETNEEYAREDFKEEFKNVPKDKQNYHDLIELGLENLAERFDERVSENGSEDTIMYEIRILYAGIDENGEHTAYVSAAVNWEGPYHRSHISWMPGFKCEDSKEVCVTFKGLRDAKEKIKKALTKVTKIF